MGLDLDMAEADRGGVLVLSLAGRLDTRNAPLFEDRLLGHIAAGRHLVAIDFGRLDFLCSGGLRVLVMAAKRLAGAGRGLALCALSENVHTVLDVAGLAPVFEIRPSAADAAAWLLATRAAG